jgi:hypothetical protein
MQDVPNIGAQPFASSPLAKCAPVAAASAPAGPTSASSSPETPLAFRALLERLRDQARALERSTEQPLSAHELPGAVQAAQASLSGALSIADELVEAYRAGAMNDRSAPMNDRSSPMNDRSGPMSDRSGPMNDRSGPMIDRSAQRA